MLYLVTAELGQPTSAQPYLIALKLKLGAIHVLSTTWLVSNPSALSAEDLAQDVRQQANLGDADKLFVTEVAGTAFGSGIPIPPRALEHVYHSARKLA
jgi:hypothetical protein